ncbi:MAG: hypothetical protein Pg6C_05510 [Treponemataceae bacterium]|nr:MAG: hypothetical protein Pg6C_05510 [Treponemataceae bacterium]
MELVEQVNREIKTLPEETVKNVLEYVLFQKYRLGIYADDSDYLDNIPEPSNPESARKLALLAQINSSLEKLNETEPLPPEFDEMLSRRVGFAKEIEL